MPATKAPPMISPLRPRTDRRIPKYPALGAGGFAVISALACTRPTPAFDDTPVAAASHPATPATSPSPIPPSAPPLPPPEVAPLPSESANPTLLSPQPSASPITVFRVDKRPLSDFVEPCHGGKCPDTFFLSLRLKDAHQIRARIRYCTRTRVGSGTVKVKARIKAKGQVVQAEDVEVNSGDGDPVVLDCIHDLVKSATFERSHGGDRVREITLSPKDRPSIFDE